MSTAAEAAQVIPLDQADALVESFGHRAEETIVRDLRLQCTDLDPRSGHAEFQLSVRDGPQMAVAVDAVSSVLKSVGVPAAAAEEYADAPELLCRLIDHSSAKRAQCPVRVGVVRNTVVGVEPGQRPALTLPAVWEQVRRVDGVCGLARLDALPRGRFNFRLVTEYTVHPVRDPGDVSHAGFRVSTNGVVSLAPYVLRLVCYNGMQCAVEGYEIAVDVEEGRTLTESLFAAAQLVSFGSRGVAAGFVGMTGTHIGNVQDYVLHRLGVLGVGDAQRARIADQIEDGTVHNTVYDVINLVAAQAHNEGAVGADKFERLAGAVLHTHVHTESCPRCKRSL